MKNYENELLEIFEELKDYTIISIRDLDKLIEKITYCSNKISCQRVELEISRDQWRKKYESLKQTEVKK